MSKNILRNNALRAACRDLRLHKIVIAPEIAVPALDLKD